MQAEEKPSWWRFGRNQLKILDPLLVTSGILIPTSQLEEVEPDRSADTSWRGWLALSPPCAPSSSQGRTWKVTCMFTHKGTSRRSSCICKKNKNPASQPTSLWTERKFQNLTAGWTISILELSADMSTTSVFSFSSWHLSHHQSPHVIYLHLCALFVKLLKKKSWVWCKFFLKHFWNNLKMLLPSTLHANRPPLKFTSRSVWTNIESLRTVYLLFPSKTILWSLFKDITQHCLGPVFCCPAQCDCENMPDSSALLSWPGRCVSVR